MLTLVRADGQMALQSLLYISPFAYFYS